MVSTSSRYLVRYVNCHIISTVCKTIARSALTYIVQDNEMLRPATVMVADGIKNAFSNDSRKELFNKKRKEERADYCEHEVVYQKQRLQLEGLSVSHQFSTTKNNCIVNGHED